MKRKLDPRRNNYKVISGIHFKISVYQVKYKMLLICYAKLLQSCPTLCDPIDSNPPGSAIPGILQARTLERVAISISSAWKWKVKVKKLSCARLLVTPWTAAYQAPRSMGPSRQEYWSGVSLPSPVVNIPPDIFLYDASSTHTTLWRALHQTSVFLIWCLHVHITNTHDIRLMAKASGIFGKSTREYLDISLCYHILHAFPQTCNFRSVFRNRVCVHAC